MSFEPEFGPRGCPRTRLLLMARWITLGSIFLSLVVLSAGCPKPVPTSVPPCPAWELDTIADYERLIELEDAGLVSPKLDRLHEYLERQTTWCHALEAYRKEAAQ